MNKLIEALKNSKKIAIFIHTNPDCDAVSSALSLALFLRKDGKIADIFSQDDVNDRLTYLPRFSEIFNVKNSDSYDTSLAVDLNEVSRMGTTQTLFLKSKTQLFIDHHEYKGKTSPYKLIDSKACASAEIVYRVLKAYNINYIDSEIASLIFAGILTDSGGFIYDNVSKETFIAASELFSYGFDAPKLSRIQLKQRTIEEFNLTNLVVPRTVFYHNNQVAVITIFNGDYEKTNTTSLNTEGIINRIIDLKGVLFAFVVSEVKNKVFKVSIRSKDGYNSAECAEAFGGGGHRGAAGCKINDYAEEAVRQLVSVAVEIIEKK